MRAIKLRSYGERSDVEAWTDCFVSDYRTLFLLSVVGHDSAVKAINSGLLEGNKNSLDIYIIPEPGAERNYHNQYLNRASDKTIHYERRAVKIGAGNVHELVMDTRFFKADRHGNRLMLVRPGEDAARLVYDTVIRNVATPTLPEWSDAIFAALWGRRYGYDHGFAKTFDGYPTGYQVVMVNVDETSLDKIVSNLVKQGEITWN